VFLKTADTDNIFFAELSIAKWATSMVDMARKHYLVYGISPLLENILSIFVTRQTNIGKSRLLNLPMFNKT
jgi:hypothetical protein